MSGHRHRVVNGFIGKPVGLWVENRADADDLQFLGMLAVEYNRRMAFYMDMKGKNLRVVKNQADSLGAIS